MRSLPLQADFWRARPVAHAADECRIVFRQTERVPGILLWLAV